MSEIAVWVDKNEKVERIHHQPNVLSGKNVSEYHITESEPDAFAGRKNRGPPEHAEASDVAYEAVPELYYSPENDEFYALWGDEPRLSIPDEDLDKLREICSDDEKLIDILQRHL